jgi:hypothetical protein
MTSSAVRSLALLAVVFMAGALSGVAVDRVYAPQQPAGVRIRTIVPDLLDGLDLTTEQRRAADSVLRKSSPRSEAAMREIKPRLAAISDSVNAELRRLLTPAQAAKLDSLTSRRQFLIKRTDSTGIVRVDTIPAGNH